MSAKSMYRAFFLICLLLSSGAGLQAQITIHGHRGARGYLPENSIPGFLKALDLGATYLEMDLVVSGDGELIVSHEPWFAHKICRDGEGKVPKGKRPLIFEMSLSEIEAYDCGCSGHPDFPEQAAMSVRKPSLEAVVAACDAYTRKHGLPLPHYNLEIKSRKKKDDKWQPKPAQFVAILAKEMTEQGILDRVIVQSFDRRILQNLRTRLADVPLGLLVFDPRSVEKQLKLLGFVPDYFNPHHKLLSKKMIASAHAAGVKVVPWTVNKVEDMEKARALGVDGIITDFPDVAAKLNQTHSPNP